MADETPRVHGFSSRTQGSWEGDPRLRGANAFVPCCWSLRNTNEGQGPASSGLFLSLKSVSAEDRRGRQDSPARPLVPADQLGASGLLAASDEASCPLRHPRASWDSQLPGRRFLVASLNFRSFSPRRGH